MSIGALAAENWFGAVTTLTFAIIFRFSADWLMHHARERRMGDRIKNLESDVAGMQAELARITSSRGGAVELGVGKSKRRFAAEEIVFLKAAGNYTEVHTLNRVHTVYGTLKAMLPQLTQPRFARVHRSYVVNLQHVRSIQSSEVVLDVGTLPISTLRRGSLRAAWERWRALQN